MDNLDTVESVVDTRPVSDMSDREILEEILVTMRTVGAALAEFQNGGMGKMVMGMFGRK